ncbi:MAG: phosphoglycerate kinase [Alphaproteobacteria bacterium]|nr:phosphoglycerate kinase [Alphaproteobacteria bacterium]MCD8571360.1 phosphoglycerate kinase [Alphaproteobacteria bacterium]
MTFQTITNLDLHNKTVLLRADLNVPVQSSKVTDTTRIDRLKPTIDHLRKAGAKVLILSHFGRPEGERNPQMSLAFLTPVLQECWGVDVSFIPECIGPSAESGAKNLQPGQIALLENVRFHKGEEANDPYFTQQLAKLGDIYVNDAFSAAHRAHASTEGLAHLLPSAAGLLMQAELEALDKALGNPQKPVCAITGGSKISTKLSVLKNLIDKVDILVLGGAMANTFLFAQGADVGGSMYEASMADEARSIMSYAESRGCKIIVPADSVCVAEIKPDAPFKIIDSKAIPPDMRAIDVGPATIVEVTNLLDTCRTVVWNGPMGVFEIKPFDAGTNALAKAVAERTKSGKLVSIAGGGDTVAALENAGVADDISYISTAGGAFLEWLEGKTLPGVAALLKQSKAA